MFGRATITLGIGPHSSFSILYTFSAVVTPRSAIPAVAELVFSPVTMNFDL